jgi:uncharacterized protein YecE (DUF72 family)
MDRYIGCSGYHYKAWVDKLYPAGLQKEKWLEYYSGFFNSVEINNSFYGTPSEKTFIKWKSQTPDNFRFSVKANRYFTHLKRIITDSEFKSRLYDFEKITSLLGDKLGCILWQLPGNFKINLQRLKSFTGILSKNISHVIEFRDRSWFVNDTYEIMKESKVAFSMISAPDDLPEDQVVTSGIAYLRMHGRTAWYNYYYSTEELMKWKKRTDELKADSIYIYFSITT